MVLKARQLGMSWLALGYALWLMIFWPAATVLLFSKRDDEAVHLLDFRLAGMYRRLPPWAQARATLIDSKHELRLSSGSAALAFPTTGGRSYTASLAIVDEADFVPNLDALLNAVKPTIDAGGRLILLSTSDKSRPDSAFKRIYRAARAGQTDYAPAFLPWSARPGRTAEWYEAVKAEIQARTGSLDDLWQEYPATDFEALAPRTLDKRLAPAWLARCDGTAHPPLDPALLSPPPPAIPGLAIYALPQPGHAYVAGADPAEGNPQSDDSALTVLDAQSGDEVASLAGRFEPSVFAAYVDEVCTYFGAAILVERNNHGHAVLQWLRDNGRTQILAGFNGKPGWLTNSRGKALMYAHAADQIRDGQTRVRTPATLTQLASIEGSTLSAPAGMLDDLATSYVLALTAIALQLHGTGESTVIPPEDPLDDEDFDTGGW